MMPRPRPDTSVAAALSMVHRLEITRVDQEASRQRALARARAQQRSLEALRCGYAALDRRATAARDAAAQRRELSERRDREEGERRARIAAARASAARAAELRLTRLRLKLLTDAPPEPRAPRVLAALGGAAAALLALAIAWVPSSRDPNEAALHEARATIDEKRAAVDERAAEVERLRLVVDELRAAADARRAAAIAAPTSTESPLAEPGPKPTRGRRTGASTPRPERAGETAPAQPPKRPKIDLSTLGDDPLGSLGA